MSDNEENIDSVVKEHSKKIDEHGAQISTVQTITTLGFIIALITLAGVIIAFAAFTYSQVQQTTRQTQLLQEIKDKVSK